MSADRNEFCPNQCPMWDRRGAKVGLFLGEFVRKWGFAPNKNFGRETVDGRNGANSSGNRDVFKAAAEMRLENVGAKPSAGRELSTMLSGPKFNADNDLQSAESVQRVLLQRRAIWKVTRPQTPGNQTWRVSWKKYQNLLICSPNFFLMQESGLPQRNCAYLPSLPT